MTTDRYLRVVLTVIAIALLLIAMNPRIAPRAATAQPQTQKAVPVYIVDGPRGLFTYAKIGTDGALRVETPVKTP